VERWATFDCYGTLVDWRAGIGGELARLFGDERAPRLLEAYYRLEPDVQANGRLAYRDVLAGTLRRVAEEAGLGVPPGEEDALARSLPGWPVFPDVRPSLEEVRSRGWRLAILSNSDRDLIESSIEAIGVPFDHVVAASEIGSYKPAPRHWEVFAEQTGAASGAHVHVAQSAFHDIATAAALGLPSVWINRLGQPPGPPCSRELPGLGGLADALDDLVPA
jgi:2-haloacid dehalogenase